MKNVFSGLLVVVAMALTGCRSVTPVAGPPPDGNTVLNVTIELGELSPVARLVTELPIVASSANSTAP